jgi:hypothetical protein
MSIIANEEPVGQREKVRAPRVPPNYFAIAFGLAGLVEAAPS